ncbi:MAG: outer membrane protein assembly factor BamD [Panacagrimonas sp.]
MKISSLLVAVLAIFLMVGCSSNPKQDDKDSPDKDTRDPDRATVFKDELDPLAERRRLERDAKLNAAQLYFRARRELDRSDFLGAIESYDDLSKRFPFSDYATQGELERIYALYRNFDHDRATSSADRFLREHPRHSAVDYVHYLKGLINYARDESTLNILPVDETKSDVSSHRRAFDDFSLLIQRFPNSPYSGDAYARMVHIRNRLAAHELHVVDFYVRRGAYVAAAKRGEQVIAQYPGTPASYRALEMLVKCYALSGMKQQEEDARKLLAAQERPKGLDQAGAENLPRLSEVSAPPAKPGFFTRVANFFSPFDSSKPDAGVELIIPSNTTDKAEAEADKAQVAAEEKPAEAKDGSKLEVFYESPDEPRRGNDQTVPERNEPVVPDNAP